MSKEKEVSVNSNGIGFVGLLTIVFITLKLTGYINWSWVWVLSPIWISVSIGLCIFFLIFLLTFVITWLNTK